MLELQKENTKADLLLSLHKKRSFPLRVSPVNMCKSAVSCGFGHIYCRNLQRKTSFFLKSVIPFFLDHFKTMFIMFPNFSDHFNTRLKFSPYSCL